MGSLKKKINILPKNLNIRSDNEAGKKKKEKKKKTPCLLCWSDLFLFEKAVLRFNCLFFKIQFTLITCFKSARIESVTIWILYSLLLLQQNI